jgi:hypothetical protein
MRSTRDLSIVIWLLCAALVAGCAGDRMNQSTEEAVDDSLLANKVKMALYADKQVRGRQITVEASQGVMNLAPSGRTLLLSDVSDAFPTASSHPQCCQRELGHGLFPIPVSASY